MALFAFDGTWNKERDAGEYGRNTNVVLFHRAYHDDASEFYTKGVGTKHRLIGKILGGAFGVGGHSRIKKAYEDLCDHYAARKKVDPNEEIAIDIIGFSRGAALALDFVNTIAKKGIREPNSKRVLVKDPTIRFLGLWDVVGAFGIPFSLGIDFQRINLGHTLKLPSNLTIQNKFHALALDERRQTFRVTRVKGCHEVWFRGVHSDVGGGNLNPGLNLISLRWMLRRAIQAGLPIPPEEVAKIDGQCVPDTPIRPASMDLIKNSLRKIEQDDLVHWTVTDRPECNNPVATCKRETKEMELGTQQSEAAHA